MPTSNRESPLTLFLSIVPGLTKIKSFQANGLPLVGDTAVRNVFESKLLFGYKRNMGCSELEEVRLILLPPPP